MGARWTSLEFDLIHSTFPATLLAMAGHDLRQPLQVITNAHDLSAAIMHSVEQRKQLTRATDAAAQLAGMLGQIVEALQLHERWGDHLRAPVRLQPILADLAAEFTEPARRKGIRFRVMSARGAALSHPILLTGMLRNLIRNAIEYTTSGGDVVVATRRCASELRIEVRDTGNGIRASKLPGIFAAFERADETRADGLGLGLFMVKRAADLLAHRVEVRSIEGRGSCFTVVVDAIRYRAKPAHRYRPVRTTEPRIFLRHGESVTLSPSEPYGAIDSWPST
jgi:two-component system phosphate regulon sensor histidine kinase PhoR